MHGGRWVFMKHAPTKFCRFRSVYHSTQSVTHSTLHPTISTENLKTLDGFHVGIDVSLKQNCRKPLRS